MIDANALLRTLIEVLNNSQRGFADFSQRMKDQQMKAHFLKESHTLRDFAWELEATANLGPNIGETASGLEHRVWGDMKADLGARDHRSGNKVISRGRMIR